jgi:hypothetical protein
VLVLESARKMPIMKVESTRCHRVKSNMDEKGGIRTGVPWEIHIKGAVGIDQPHSQTECVGWSDGGRS